MAAFLSACGGTLPPSTAPTPTHPNAPYKGTGQVVAIEFQNVNANQPSAQAHTLTSRLGAQGLSSLPDQFAFEPKSSFTFTDKTTSIRHVRATFKVTNNSGAAVPFLTLIPISTQDDGDPNTTPTSTPTIGTTTFKNVRLFSGADVPAKAASLTPVQGKNYLAASGQVIVDSSATPFLTGLNVSGLTPAISAGLALREVKTYGWQVPTYLPAGGSTFVTFAVDVPMDAAGPTADPYTFTLMITLAQGNVSVSGSSAVKQFDRTAGAYGNYKQLAVSGGQSLATYYDLTPSPADAPVVLCPGDAGTTVEDIHTAAFPNRYRVRVNSLGAHSLQAFEGSSCSASGTPLWSESLLGTTFKQPLTNGYAQSMAVKADGTVTAWGVTYLLGNGTNTNDAVPTPTTISGLSNVAAVSASPSFTAALKQDGTVMAWGLNSSGQLGNGTTTNSYTPVNVSGLTNAVALAAGGGHSLALRSDGTVAAWGNNDYGQLGNGTTTSSNVPVTVNGLSDVVAIAAGANGSLALRADGKVFAWGERLANTLLSENKTPLEVPGLTDIAAIAMGYGTGIAVKSDGTVYTWGFNYYGQLGDGTTNTRLTPQLVPGLSNIISVRTGATSIALKSDGTVYTWGFNGNGQLGNGTTTDSSTTAVVAGLSGITYISMNANHGMALKSDGTVYTWGANWSGQLGDGTTTQRLSPVTVTGLTGMAQPVP